MTANRILVVEDEWLIAAETEDLLTAAGWLVVGPAPTVERALSLLSEQAIDVAILDIHLGDERSFPVADALAARAIPFLFMSGFLKGDLPEAYRHHTLLCKPARADILLAEVASIMKE